MNSEWKLCRKPSRPFPPHLGRKPRVVMVPLLMQQGYLISLSCHLITGILFCICLLQGNCRRPFGSFFAFHFDQFWVCRTKGINCRRPAASCFIFHPEFHLAEPKKQRKMGWFILVFCFVFAKTKGVAEDWIITLSFISFVSCRKYHGVDKASCLSDVLRGKVEVVVTTFETCRDNIVSHNSWWCWLDGVCLAWKSSECDPKS